MIKIIFILVLSFLAQSVASYAEIQKVYSIDLSIINGTIEKWDVYVGNLMFEEDIIKSEKSYKADLISFEDMVLYTKLFEFDIIVIEDKSNEWVSAAGKNLLMPYSATGKRIDVYNPQNEKILEIPVVQFADTCGSGVCEPQESYESCAADCKSGGRDDYCDRIADGVCDADCAAGQDVDCHDTDKTQSGVSAEEWQLMMAIAFAVAVIIGALWYYRRKKAKRSLNGFRW